MRLGAPTVEPPNVVPELGHAWDLDGPDGLALELAAWRRLEWERAQPPAPASWPRTPVLTPYHDGTELVDPNAAEYLRNPYWPWVSSTEPAPDWREREAAWDRDVARPPKAPARGSLDTLATARHWDRRATARMLDADRIKAQLAPVIRTAAGARWAAGELGAAVWLDKRATALSGCRDVRAFRDASCGAYTARPSSCRVRVCPDCERSRSSRLVARLDALTLDMSRPVFWTFTVPNVPAGQLTRGVDWLLSAFRALRRRAVIRGGKCRDCRATHRPVLGGVYSIEVTRGRDAASWHPHVHVLMDAPWIRWAELRDAWRAVTCDAIRRLELGKGRKLPRCAHPADSRGLATDGCRGASVLWVEAIAGEPGSDHRRAALREVLKYATGGLVKDGKLAAGIDAGSIAELLLALRNRRLVAGWGGWHHVTDDDPEDEAPAEDYVLVEVGERDGRTVYARMPARCPCCRGPALWEAPIMVPRRSCTARDGALIWRPPRAGPPV